MTEHTFTIDAVELIDDEWAVWATIDDGSGVMGYGDTRAAAISDVAHNVEIAFAGDTTIDPPDEPAIEVDIPEPMLFTFTAPTFGSGLLGGDHDLLI